MYALVILHLISQFFTSNISNMTSTAPELNMNTAELHYLIQEPKTKTGINKAIVLLHGVGSNEQDLFGLADQLPSDFYVLSVRAPFALGAGRFAWYNVDFSSGKPVFDVEQELTSRDLLTRFVTEIKVKYKLEKVFLGGFSQGAIMSYSVGLSHPTEITGVVALSGRILEEIQRTITSGEDLSKLNVFLAHGIQDDKLPIHYARSGENISGKTQCKTVVSRIPNGTSDQYSGIKGS
jgi:phospholipase/carboxylesterase